MVAQGNVLVVKNEYLSSMIIRFVCMEGYFGYPRREVRDCMLVCKSWNEALVEMPVDDILWRDCDWVKENFGPRSKLWKLRTVHLTADNNKNRLGIPWGRLHRLEPLLKCPLLSIQPSLKGLMSLSLTQEVCNQASLSALKVCEDLRYLQLANVGGDYHDLRFLRKSKRLETLQIFHAKNLEDISTLGMSCKNLKHLVIRHCTQLTNLDGIRECRMLESIDFTGAGKLENIESIGMCFQLKKLVLICCVSLKSIAPLAGLDQIELLFLSHCKLLTSLRALRNKKRLRSLWLASCLGIKRIDDLTSCTALNTLSIGHCQNLFRAHLLEPLYKCQNLQELYANGLHPSELPRVPHRNTTNNRSHSRNRLYVSTDSIFYSCSLLARYGNREDSIYFPW